MSTVYETDVLVEKYGGLEGVKYVMTTEALSKLMNSSTGFSPATMPSKLKRVCKEQLRISPKAWIRVNADRSLDFDGNVTYPVYVVWNSRRRELVYNYMLAIV